MAAEGYSHRFLQGKVLQIFLALQEEKSNWGGWIFYYRGLAISKSILLSTGKSLSTVFQIIPISTPKYS